MYLKGMLFLCCFATNILGRHLNRANDGEQSDYDSLYETRAERTYRNENEVHANKQELNSLNDGHETHDTDTIDFSGNTYLQRGSSNSKAKGFDKFSEKMPSSKDYQDEIIDDTLDSFKESQGLNKRHKIDSYAENPDNVHSEISQNENKRDISNFKSQYKSYLGRDNQIDKRIVNANGGANKEDAALLEYISGGKHDLDKTEFKVENNEIKDHPLDLKKHSATIHTNDRRNYNDKKFENIQFNGITRDRRHAGDIKDQEQSITNGNNIEQGDSTEDEETAIRKHVKKLSSDELQELFNSLSEDKRTLLKKIMEEDAYNANDVSKREIAKRINLEDNRFPDFSSTDANKIQNTEMNSVASTVSSTSENQQSFKNPDVQPDGIDTSTTTSTEGTTLGSTADMMCEKTQYCSHRGESHQVTESNVNTVDNIKNEVNIESSDLISKTENKREINTYDVNMSDDNSAMDEILQNGQPLVDSHMIEPSQLNDGEVQIDDDTLSKNKREANAVELSDSLKSLEDSFPNSNSYDDSDHYSACDMAPLVRVKRRNLDPFIKKRSVALLPDAKVGFFPYRAENEDEDNDEGNEFDDDGFYDRTSNYAKCDSNKNKEINQDTSDIEEMHPRHSKFLNKKNYVKRSKSLRNLNLRRDSAKIGSDTDSVLSGVEGVDENLMYNSASRSRRTLIDSMIKEPSNDLLRTSQDNYLGHEPLNSDTVKTAPESYINQVPYQENDAFGPLPRNYEGELGRYKRVRRVKQQPTDEDTISE